MLSLSEDQARALDADGYVVVPGALDPVADLQPVLDEYAALVDGIADRLVSEGKLTRPHDELDLERRVIAIARECGTEWAYELDISPTAASDGAMVIHTGPAVFALLTNRGLVDLVADVLGTDEVFCTPVQHFRFKLPIETLERGNGLVATTPWHQDNGVVEPEADHTPMLTVWVPLRDATEENGCLRVIPGSHRSGLRPHCPFPEGLSIAARHLPARAPVSVPVPAGGVFIQHRLTVHASGDNVTTDQVRFSFDLRYQPTGFPTGRKQFPGFVARSRMQPTTVLEWEGWRPLWEAAWRRLPENRPVFRWPVDPTLCA